VDGEVTGTDGALRHNPLTPTIFHESWWLEAATGGAYQEVVVTWGGRTVGRFPFLLKRLPIGLVECSMPGLAHFLGPAIDAGSGARVTQATRHDAILRELLGRLPAHTGLYQKLHRATLNTLLFQEQGYGTTVQFTFDVPPAPEASLWSGMRDKTRNAIRRAEVRYRVEDLSDPGRFVHAYKANLAARGLVNHYPRMQAVCSAALDRGRGRMLAAMGPSGAIAACILYVWDADAAYYLLSSRDLESGNGAVSLLIWEAMRDSARRGLVFDFDGVGNAGSRVFYSGFGGTAMPRFIVFRYSLGHRLLARLASRRVATGPDVTGSERKRRTWFS
jgi:hypothetical protein